MCECLCCARVGKEASQGRDRKHSPLSSFSESLRRKIILMSCPVLHAISTHSSLPVDLVALSLPVSLSPVNDGANERGRGWERIYEKERRGERSRKFIHPDRQVPASAV